MSRYALFLAAVTCALAAVPATAGSQFAGSPTSREMTWILHHQELVRGRLKDGKSAEFRNQYVSRAGGAPIVCGEVNAKNSFGAYAGFERWIGAEPAIGVVLESDFATGEFAPVWAKYCAQR